MKRVFDWLMTGVGFSFVVVVPAYLAYMEWRSYHFVPPSAFEFVAGDQEAGV